MVVRRQVLLSLTRLPSESESGPSFNHLKFLAHFFLNSYKISCMASNTFCLYSPRVFLRERKKVQFVTTHRLMPCRRFQGSKHVLRLNLAGLNTHSDRSNEGSLAALKDRPHLLPCLPPSVVWPSLTTRYFSKNGSLRMAEAFIPE